MSPPADDAADGDVGPARDSDAEPTDAGRSRTKRSDTAGRGPSGASATDEGVALLPDAGVDSRWWYWIAAVPLYFVFTTVVGALLFAVVVLGLFLDGGMTVFALFSLLVLFVAVPGLVLTVLFPVAIYVDARAIRDADLSWQPDPALYGMVALVGVLVTAFVVSVPLGVYYLYRRHRAVGVP